MMIADAWSARFRYLLFFHDPEIVVASHCNKTFQSIVRR